MFQFDALKQYIEKGGSLLFLLGEGGESRFDTNINFLLEDYGIMVNNGKYDMSVETKWMMLYSIMTMDRRDMKSLF